LAIRRGGGNAEARQAAAFLTPGFAQRVPRRNRLGYFSTATVAAVYDRRLRVVSAVMDRRYRIPTEFKAIPRLADVAGCR